MNDIFSRGIELSDVEAALILGSRRSTFDEIIVIRGRLHGRVLDMIDRVHQLENRIMPSIANIAVGATLAFEATEPTDQSLEPLSS
ncbi:MAG: hypothetical protein JWO47_603 [Candidatus Saccharibacteria bacterium]|nr:hypothetical protein [Candidatus Saccharibacteria bacterium]